MGERKRYRHALKLVWVHPDGHPGYEGKRHGTDVLRALTVTSPICSRDDSKQPCLSREKGTWGREAEGRQTLAYVCVSMHAKEDKSLIKTHSLLNWHHGTVISKNQSVHGGVSDCSGHAVTWRQQGHHDVEILVRKMKCTTAMSQHESPAYTQYPFVQSISWSSWSLKKLFLGISKCHWGYNHCGQEQ